MHQAVFHDGLEDEPRDERVVYLRVSLDLPLQAASETAALKLKITAQQVEAAAHAGRLAASVQAQPEKLTHVVDYLRSLLVVVFQRAPIGGVQHVVEKMRVHLHLEHGELSFLFTELEDVVELDKAAVFLHHVVEHLPKAADVVLAAEVGLRTVVALGETHHGLREFGKRLCEHTDEHTRQGEHGYEKQADEEKCGADDGGLAPKRGAVGLYDAADKRRAFADLAVDVVALAIKVVEHHAEQVHLKQGADKQLLHTLRWNGLARVAEIHELLRLGGGDVVFGQAVNIALVLLDKYAHVVEGQQAAGVLLLHYIAQAAP